MSVLDFNTGGFNANQFNWNSQGYINPAIPASPVPVLAPPMASVGASNPGAMAMQAATSAPAVAAGPAATSGAPGPWQGMGLGMNMGTANLVLGGLQTIGSLWTAFQANKLAKQQFSFQKDVTEANLANQIKSYNTTLEGTARARASFEGGENGGMKLSEVDDYVEKHKLSRDHGRPVK